VDDNSRSREVARVAVLGICAADETDEGSERRTGGRKDHRQS
jgi:hypothetical protein